MKKIVFNNLVLLFLISIIIASSPANLIAQDGVSKIDDVNYIDGPYVFYKGDKIHVIRVNKHNELTEEITDRVDSLLVETPNYTPKQFYVKLKSKNVNPPSIYKKADKIFAVSDIEGNYYTYINLLIGNKIIDENLNWIFGTGHFVFNGDIVDRGEEVTPLMWLTYKLEHEAAAAGGQVHMINGNHEVMNLEGDHRYVAKKYVNLAKKLNLSAEEFYNDNNEMGRWLRSKNIMEKIGDLLFIHAGISPTMLRANLDIESINQIALENYGANLENDTLTNSNLIFGRYGIFWYRGLVSDYKYYPKSSMQEVDQFLNFYESSKVIIGHTIVDDISSDYEGKVIRIDIHHPTDKNSPKESRALLIENNMFYNVDIHGNKKGILKH